MKAWKGFISKKFLVKRALERDLGVGGQGVRDEEAINAAREVSQRLAYKRLCMLKERV